MIDQNLHVFGYHNMLVCDGSAMPANPGVNPALTITALAEHAMAQIPPKNPGPREPAPLNRVGRAKTWPTM